MRGGSVLLARLDAPHTTVAGEGRDVAARRHQGKGGPRPRGCRRDGGVTAVVTPGPTTRVRTTFSSAGPERDSACVGGLIY